MKRFGWVLFGSGFVAVLLVVGVAGEKTAKAEAEAKAAAWEPSFAEMDRHLGLEPAQQTQLKKLWAERNHALASWDRSEPGKQLAELRGELVVAAVAQRGGLESRIAPLQAQRGLLDREHLTRIMAVLTQEQQTKWNALRLREVVKAFLGKEMSLTPEQEQKVSTLCDRAAKALPAVPTSTDMAGARDQICRAILADIRSAAQPTKVDPDDRATGRSKSEADDRDNGRKRAKGRGDAKKRKRANRDASSRGKNKRNRKGKGKGGNMRKAMTAAAKKALADREKVDKAKADKSKGGKGKADKGKGKRGKGKASKRKADKAGYVQFVGKPGKKKAPAEPKSKKD